MKAICPECGRRIANSEYRTVANAFEKEVAPHIDYKLAKGVIEANWLPGPVLRSEPQK